MTNYPKLIKDYDAGLFDPNTEVHAQMVRFKALVQACSAGEDLSEKAKELIALAIAISANCEGCIKVHAAAAHKAGVTRNEIGAMIGIATMMGCGPSSVYGLKALRAYDSFAAEAD